MRSNETGITVRTASPRAAFLGALATSRALTRASICTITAAGMTLGVVACKDSKAPTGPGVRAEGLSLTPASGVTNLVLVRGTTGALKVASKHDGFKSRLSTDGVTDVVVNENSMSPGGTSGWHIHPGVTIITIKSGTLTLYDADDPDCLPHAYGAGQVFVEAGGAPHIARNEGATAAKWYTTYLVPTGGATRIDAPAPGNCPF